MKFFISNIFIAIFLLNTNKAENVDSYLQQQSISIANGMPRTMLPRGTVLMCATDEIDHWFNMNGKGLGEYSGWFICDGRNGTPDLSGRFVVGRNALDTNSEYNKTGAKGGARSVKLTESQIPSHSHRVALNTSTQGHHSHPYVDVLFPVEGMHTNIWPDLGQGGYGWVATNTRQKNTYVTRPAETSGSGEHVHSVSGRTESTGDNASIDIRPPYYTVVYIVYRGTDESH